MNTTNNLNYTISSLAYAYYTDNIFKIAEELEVLRNSGYTPDEINTMMEAEYNKRFRNNPYREKRYKKNYK